jgi:predicted GIY-YIG superfamily endonuclease
MNTEKTALYRHWDSSGALLYVGVSWSVVTRTAQHASKKAWFSQVVNISVEWFPSREMAESAERAAIIRERPKYNSTWNRAPVTHTPRQPERRPRRRPETYLLSVPPTPAERAFIIDLLIKDGCRFTAQEFNALTPGERTKALSRGYQ